MATFPAEEGAGLRELDDQSLLDRIVRGDERALAELYERFSPRAFGVARRVLRNDAEAEELVQDTFVEVWRSATRYDPRRAAPERWILTMVRTRAIDRLRQNGARGRLRDHLLVQPKSEGLTSPDVQLVPAGKRSGCARRSPPCPQSSGWCSSTRTTWACRRARSPRPPARPWAR